MEGVVVAGREVVRRVNYRVGRHVKAAHWVVQRDYHHLPLRFMEPIMKGWNFTGFLFFPNIDQRIKGRNGYRNDSRNVYLFF